MNIHIYWEVKLLNSVHTVSEKKIKKSKNPD